ncbi:carboxymuconolactone decarboxylase family protein [Planctomycetota bacterium]
MESSPPYRKIREKYPAMAKAYDALGKAAYEAGPLSPVERRFVKLALAIGAGLEGAVHGHVRRALEEGISPDKLHHAALLTATTLGFPTAMRSFTWVEDVIQASSSPTGTYTAEDL